MDVHTRNGHIYRDVLNFNPVGFNGASGYVRFEQKSGDAVLPSTYNRNEIIKLVL